uniref:VP4 n=1 Tax=Neuropteran jingmen-related virus TaxID=2822568 RepID=A0A8A6RH80_9FLAV|nr:VP4 [Neuropteran jingmen-related virus]
MKEVMLIMFFLFVSVHCGDNNTKANLAKAWKWDLTGFSLDPNSWTDTWKQKMAYVAALGCYMASINYSYMTVGMVVALALGLVQLSWPLVAALCATAYGYKYKKQIFLGLGAVVSYCLAFGYSIV